MKPREVLDGGGAEATTRRVSRVRLGCSPRDREASPPPPGASSWLEFLSSPRALVASLARSWVNAPPRAWRVTSANLRSRIPLVVVNDAHGRTGMSFDPCE